MTIEQRPDCDICGRPYLQHHEIMGAGRVCPVSALTYRAKRAQQPSPSDGLAKRMEQYSRVHGLLGDDDRAFFGQVARALTTREAAVEAVAALAAIEKLRAINAADFKRSGREWKAYDDAVLECHAAIRALAPANAEPVEDGATVGRAAVERVADELAHASTKATYLLALPSWQPKRSDFTTLRDEVRLAYNSLRALAPVEQDEPVEVFADKMKSAIAEIEQEWRWGNITKLGIVNFYTRKGFRWEWAIEQAERLSPAEPVDVGDLGPVLARLRARSGCPEIDIGPVDVGPEIAAREAGGDHYTKERFGDLTDPPSTWKGDPGCP